MMDKYLFERLVSESGQTQRLTGVGRVFTDEQLERLMALVAEECAKKCDAAQDFEAQAMGAVIRTMFKEPCTHPKAVVQTTGDGSQVLFCPDCGRNTLHQLSPQAED